MELLTVTEVAEMMKVQKNYVYQLKANRQIPYVSINGLLRFKKDEVISWIESHSVCEK